MPNPLTTTEESPMSQSSKLSLTGKKPCCLSFTAEINQQTTEALMGAMGTVSQEHDEILLMFSTPGGSVSSGIAVYNMIRALPVPVTTYNIGNVDSIGNVIYQAGSKRWCAETSRFMFHGVSVDIREGSRLELKQLKELIGGIENDQKRISEIMASHTSLSEESLERLFLEMSFLGSRDAKDKGVTDEVGDINLPRGLPIAQLVFQR